MWASSSIKLECGCNIEHSVSVEKILADVTSPGDTYMCPNSHGEQTVTRVSGAEHR